MIALTGYQIINQIYESPNSLIYRGYRESDGQPVIFKMLKDDYPTAGELTRYKQEYEITKSLKIDGVVKAYSLHKYQNTLVIILEDFGGYSLSILMNSGKFNLEEILQIAIEVTTSLEEIHASNIVHKDINPSNIVFNPLTKEIKIIDFGISTKLTSENPTLKSPNVLEGTLVYMSPEQTGRMNRYLDYRTDFYSLGVTLYELLTNRLPFNSRDALELVHFHLAKQPISPHEINPEIPQTVANIVMKLLAKTAEERYQSAYGIKADLEKCLQQYRSGEISEFPLANEDICDKFQIPQKLYGREKEIETLLTVFDRITENIDKGGEETNPESKIKNRKSKIEIMLVTGYSGIGKSALVQELYKPITQQKGYFITGKFEQLQRNIPYAAISKAFGSLIKQILTESESTLSHWKEKLLSALGVNAQVIIDVIPEVELLLGKQNLLPELGAVEAQNRFNLVFQKFMRVFCQKEHPLVIFLDDLQWADLASLKLIELMARDDELGYLLLIGAYRNNEVDSTHPTIISIEGLKKEGVIIKQITLNPLSLENLIQLIAESLHGDRETVKPLAELVLRKTGGNPFFANQFLRTLYQEKLLAFDRHRKWQWNISQIEAMGITDNVVDLTIANLKKLPETAQKVLKLAACIGNAFDLNTLAIVHEKSAAETFQDILPGIQTNLIVTLSELEITEDDLINSTLLISNYKFLHDRVQQAAYALIDDRVKRAVHLQIGRLLLDKIPPGELETRIFEVVDHLNLGQQFITLETEKVSLARLNLEAGKKAKDATAYKAAQEYIILGINCLTGDYWQDCYDLSFAIHREMAEIEYLIGNFQHSEELIKLMLSKAKTAVEKAEIYSLSIVLYTTVTKYSEAIESGRKALSLLRIEFPETNLSQVFKATLNKVENQVSFQKVSSLIDRDELTQIDRILATKLLVNLIPPSYFLSVDLFSVVVALIIDISLEYGNCTYSSVGYSCYGFLLAFLLDNYQVGYEFGILSLKLNKKFKNLSLQCRDGMTFAGSISCWAKHLKESYPILNDAYNAGLEAGELNFVGYTLEHKAIILFSTGTNISSILTELSMLLQFTYKTKNNWTRDTLVSLQLTMFNLVGKTKDKFSFADHTRSEEEIISGFQIAQNFQAICFHHILKALALYLYGEFKLALNSLLSASKLFDHPHGTFLLVEYKFYHSIILIALYPNISKYKQRQYKNQIKANQNKMKKWADSCPENFLHKYLLVAAELARISKRDLEAIELYDRAIASAHENEFTQYEALGNELATKFWLDRGKEEFAQIYLRKALYCYELWGATRKVEDLLEKYPLLLAQTINSTPINSKNSNHVTYSSTDRNATSLDLATVIKASEAIFSEILLERLLASLMKILIENAGANKGYLILAKEGELFIEAEASIDANDVLVQHSIPLEKSTSLPVTVIKYVERTTDDLVLNDAASEGQFTLDRYISSNKLKSLLCTPIIKQGKLIGILYLENNLTTGAFTPERIEVLRVLSSQAAISLENALIYAKLEEKVAERTKELNEKNVRLSQTITELKRTQSQLIQTEKMSSLGQMVAGIAHEINNPINFIHGNLSFTEDYLQRLIELVELYQKTYLQPTDEIEDKIEEIELEFLLEDLVKMIDSMKTGSERIRNIVLGLRNFSRLDEADMKPVNIHEGIESTLLILQHRLTKDKGTEISIVKDYAQLPKVTCYASKLNQVFMNIISNAIDVLRMEIENSVSPPVIPTISIRTEMKDSNTVLIRIADNGPGMTEEVLHKIFDPFFTTKPVGSGTGLGLSISYQIVVDSHGGKLSCVSAPGKGAEFLIEIPISNI